MYFEVGEDGYMVPVKKGPMYFVYNNGAMLPVDEKPDESDPQYNNYFVMGPDGYLTRVDKDDEQINYNNEDEQINYNNEDMPSNGFYFDMDGKLISY